MAQVLAVRLVKVAGSSPGSDSLGRCVLGQNTSYPYVALIMPLKTCKLPTP